MIKKMSWKKDGYVVLKNALSKDLCRVLAREFRMLRDTEYFLNKVNVNNKYAFSDFVDKSFVWYGSLGFESLLDTVMKDLVEKNTKLKVHPCYSFARIYYKGAQMKAHIDRPSCEISATICIDSDVTWPIGFVNRKGKKIYIPQKPGDVIIYSGCELTHWRDRYKGKEQVQAFTHYVNAKGPYRNYKFDMRKMLGLPGNRPAKNARK